MNVRYEVPTDHAVVEKVIVEAFEGDGRKVASLAADLRAVAAEGQGLSLVAEHETSIVGHAMFTPCLLDAPRTLVLVQVLSPVSVIPSRQRQGVGTALIRHGLSVLSDRGVPVVFVEGDPGYYSRFGFVAARELGYRRPSLRIPEIAFQATRLPAYEPWMTGTFVYSSAFWAHDAVGLRSC